MSYKRNLTDLRSLCIDNNVVAKVASHLPSRGTQPG
jgi:hypothetical protein